MTRPWVLATAILPVFFTSVALAQQAQAGTAETTSGPESEISTKDSDAEIRVEVNLVLVPGVVKDSNGNLVFGLKKEDFQLLDNGKPQTVSTFSVETAESRAGSGRAIVEASPAGTETNNAAT